MINDERMLLKALEHRGMDEGVLFPSICSVLGLQYFLDEDGGSTHTFASPSFVIDIGMPSLKMTFVDEGFSRCFRYVEFSLCRLLEARNMVGFYQHLKMFARMEGGTEELQEKDSGDVCRCVFEGIYCINPSLSAVASRSTDRIYNIYRHRFEYHLYTRQFIICIPASALAEDEPCCLVKAEDVNGRPVDVRVSLNIAKYIDPGTLDREVFKSLPGTGFHWRGEVGGVEVLVENNLAVYVDGGLRRDVSFLMKVGKTLAFSLGF